MSWDLLFCKEEFYYIELNIIKSWFNVKNHPSWSQSSHGNCPLLTVPFFLNWAYNKLRRQWHPTPALLPRKSHGWRSLVGCSPWGRWGSDTTERLHFHFSFSHIEEGNGNPLQCSCLENPRDREAWWAAVYGAAQIQTRLKRLSSSRLYHTVIGWFELVLYPDWLTPIPYLLWLDDS